MTEERPSTVNGKAVLAGITEAIEATGAPLIDGFYERMARSIAAIEAEARSDPPALDAKDLHLLMWLVDERQRQAEAEGVDPDDRSSIYIRDLWQRLLDMREAARAAAEPHDLPKKVGA